MADFISEDTPSYYYDQAIKQWKLSFLETVPDGDNAVKASLYFDSEKELIDFLKR